MKKLQCVITFCFMLFWSAAQTPFICEGDFYLVLAPNNVSTAYEVEIDPNTNNVLFNPLSGGDAGVLINSIGFRSSDNFIYGINTQSNNLYQLDATGAANFITALSLNSTLGYPSGDITPDGSTLVLLGNTGGGIGVSRELAFVNLESGNYEVNSVSLTGNSVVCFDIAFDPTDGQLYGFDATGNRLILFNTVSGNVSTPFPASGNSDSMGSLFFDAFGNLFGYGSPSGTATADQNTLFSLNKNTGEVIVESTGPLAQRTDGCSCPYTIELSKFVETPQAVPCTVVEYVFEFANSSGQTQIDLTFEDVFPNEFTIVDIQNPFGGNIISGVGTSLIRIEGMAIPLGITELVVSVEIGQNALGVYGNQAVLSGLPEGLGMTVLSDFPNTIIKDDSTYITINELGIDFSNVNTNICPGETLELSPSIFGVSYEWSDGSAGATFEIDTAGTYAVTVTSGCDIAVETINVTTQPLGVDLGPDQVLFLGDSTNLVPTVFPTAMVDYNWAATTEMINCLNCPETITRPFFDAQYYVTITDENGCMANDSVAIDVVKDEKIFIPNAFSPNDDGFNDGFFLQTRVAQEIQSLKIFSRWGELVYEGQNFLTNDESRAWDGEFKGKPMPPGTYTYYAIIAFLDGTTAEWKGDLTLMR
jgi:gliding motility-associated-like protein